MIDSPFLTPEEAAAYFRVDRRTVYLWLRQGSLSGLKVGEHAWRIDREAVEKFAQHHAPKIPKRRRL